MPRGSSSQGLPLEDRLRARREELEQTALARIAAIVDPVTPTDPAYIAGLRAALTAGLDYGLAALTTPEPEPVPVQLLAQARLAARNGVSLEAVLRRYAAGHSLLADSLLDEAAAAGVGAAELKGVLRAMAARYDRIVAAVSEEYGREARVQPLSVERRRYGLVRRLLTGEPLDASELRYPFEGHHLAIVASGAAAAGALERLGERMDRCLLLVLPDEQSAWVWLGGRRPIAAEEYDFIASYPWPEGCIVACGEHGEDLTGWRLSHRQAAIALPVAQRAGHTFVRYADVALVATALQDDLLATSLRRAYLDPLEAERDNGSAAKATLRAYFGAARNVSSAAAALGVSRATVRSRLLGVEGRLGRSLDTAATEIEVALRLDALERRSAPRLQKESG